MVRKYILDSVRYWLEEYDVDGIRFDLMGILDIETVRQISKLAENVKPGALLFGEGWDLNTPLESGQKQHCKMPGKFRRSAFLMIGSETQSKGVHLSSVTADML